MPENASEPSDDEIAEYAARLVDEAEAVHRAEIRATESDCVCEGGLERDDWGIPQYVHEPDCPLR